MIGSVTVQERPTLSGRGIEDEKSAQLQRTWWSVLGADRLLTVSLLYLLLPYALFALGWLQLQWAALVGRPSQATAVPGRR
jgi:hypothetical protein